MPLKSHVLSYVFVNSAFYFMSHLLQVTFPVNRLNKVLLMLWEDGHVCIIDSCVPGMSRDLWGTQLLSLRALGLLQGISAHDPGCRLSMNTRLYPPSSLIMN
jgi:hypothetical protein